MATNRRGVTTTPVGRMGNSPPPTPDRKPKGRPPALTPEQQAEGGAYHWDQYMGDRIGSYGRQPVYEGGWTYDSSPAAGISFKSFNPVNIVKDTVKSVGDVVGDVAKPIGDAIGDVAKPIGDAIGDVAKPLGDVAGDIINKAGDIPLIPGGPSINDVIEDPLDINTYTDPAVDLAKQIDEHLLDNMLFGEVEYNPETATYADFNTDPNVLKYFNPAAAEMMAQRDFVNQQKANFLSVPTDSKTGSSMGLWDYYNAVGDADPANKAAFEAAVSAFNQQYTPQAYDDWGGLTDYERDFGQINNVAQRAGSPYLWDVSTAKGDYVYAPRDLFSGLLGDMQPARLPDTVDSDGNVIPGGFGNDIAGQTAIYGTGVDLGQGRQVIIDPSKLGGLNQITLNGTNYDILNQQGLNQGFLFTPEQLANLQLNAGQGTNTFIRPEASGGLAGDLAPILEIGGALAAPFTGGSSLLLTQIGAGLGSMQSQITADQLRAAGYDVDSSALHRGHALNAAKIGMAALNPSLEGYYKSLGISDPSLLAGASGATRGAVMGGLSDPDEPWKGAGMGAMVGGLSSYAADFLSGQPNPSDWDKFRTGTMAGQFGDYLKNTLPYYKDLNSRLSGIDPNADLTNPQGLAQAFGQLPQSSGPIDGLYIPTAAEMADYYPQANEYASMYNPRLGDMYNAATAKGFGLEGLSSYSDARQKQAANELALGEQWAQALWAQDQAKKGMIGAGGIQQQGMAGAGSIGGLRMFS